MSDIPKELRGDFPEPVGPVAARQHELRTIREEVRREDAATRAAYRTHVLAEFPQGPYFEGGVIDEAGPIPSELMDEMSRHEAVLPRVLPGPVMQVSRPRRSGAATAKRFYEEFLRGTGQRINNAPPPSPSDAVPTGMGDMVRVTDGKALRVPTVGRQVEVDGRCPCCTERIRLRYSDYRG